MAATDNTTRVQDSWRVVEKDLDTHGIKFFMRIFEIAPGALQLFSFRDVKDLEKSPELKKHASRVMGTVGKAVAGLTDVKTLIPVLQALGVQHSLYGVKGEHFPIVGEALLWTLEQGLGPAGLWTPEVKEAWTETWGTIVSVMKPALEGVSVAN
uniref:Globin domain-containing protein n=1 Tax=Hemiselmis andersenii TaxID=464988 RepID=A0A7S1DV93_HEMAN|mmetsp:Transcript_2941/g.7033  ORF Transcript_2941/g.7033 Transcript_2941/m.7033 type:complete len:154 (+) Transcript_2941:106-567(+)|eukprot:CAMPEP_0114117686 /NCGR_PEP_ID=MMETSP0043_2-20121206/5167_1 /TAXON_ID=464988 /ORGANISM="Hemiselmis andersenii, Strain CCMP644" /LENGTH=153 /DNA_ID=CAMNT_0001210097 /DNA_START=76 /DNA_END=537 /DNA_ORIENTATION=-